MQDETAAIAIVSPKTVLEGFLKEKLEETRCLRYVDIGNMKHNIAHVPELLATQCTPGS